MPRPFTNRTPPVLASRFRSKGGDRFQRGYQYRYPQPFHMTLGPWNSVWPLGNRNAPENTLQDLQDGILRDGAIYPLWGEDTDTIVDKEILGDFEFSLLGNNFRFIFRTDTGTGELEVIYTNGFTQTAIPTAIVIGGRVVGAPWQDKLYFSTATAATIYELDTSTDMVTAVPDTPALVEHMLIVRNRLVVIHRSGNSYEISWTVDSDPTDFLSIGASSAVVDGAIGQPQGFEPFLEDAMVIASNGALFISSTTRNDPAFRLTKRAEISGARVKYAVSSLRNSIFYVGTDRFAKVFDGSAERNVGVGEHPFADVVRVFTIRRLNLISFSEMDSPTTGKTLFLDPQTLEWTSTKDIGWDWISESGGPAQQVGSVFGSVQLDDDDYRRDRLVIDSPGIVAPLVPPVTSPTAKTGRYYIGREVWIDRIDLIRTDVDPKIAPSLDVTRSLGDGDTDFDQMLPNVTNNTQEQDTYITYHINAPAKSIQLLLDGSNNPSVEGGPFVALSTEQNYHVDPGNPPGEDKADLDALGNAEVGSLQHDLIGVDIDENGNLFLRVDEHFWSPNVGIERIEVYGSEQEVPFVSIG